MAIVTKTIAEVPAIDALAADDEMLVRDTSKGESARVTMQELADFVGGGGGGDASTWSQYPATQDVDMDGHDVVGLPSYDPAVDPPPSDMSAAVSASTMNNAFAFLLPQWASYKASQDVDMDGHKLTGLGAPTDAADAATKQYVDTASSVVPTKIQNGTSRVEIASANGDIEIYRAGTRVAFFWSGNGGQVIFGGPNGATLTLPETASGHASVRSGGFQSAMTSTSYLQFPSGVTSYMHGVHLAKSAADDIAAAKPRAETLSWSGVTNVDSVSHVEASIKEEGGYVDIDAAVLVTPVAAGITRASAVLSGLAPQTPRAGTASASDNATVAPASCGAVPSGGDAELTVMFDAQSTDPHTVSVRIRYEAA